MSYSRTLCVLASTVVLFALTRSESACSSVTTSASEPGDLLVGRGGANASANDQIKPIAQQCCDVKTGTCSSTSSCSPMMTPPFDCSNPPMAAQPTVLTGGTPSAGGVYTPPLVPYGCQDAGSCGSGGSGNNVLVVNGGHIAYYGVSNGGGANFYAVPSGATAVTSGIPGETIFPVLSTNVYATPSVNGNLSPGTVSGYGLHEEDCICNVCTDC